MSSSQLKGQFEVDSPTKLVEIRKFIEESADKLGADQEKTQDLILAVNEAVTNIYIHGFEKVACKVDVSVSFSDGALTVITHDNGPEFDPTRVDLPDTTASLEKRRPGGLGILMIRKYTDQFLYQRTPEHKNELVFKISA